MKRMHVTFDRHKFVNIFIERDKQGEERAEEKNILILIMHTLRIIIIEKQPASNGEQQHTQITLH